MDMKDGTNLMKLFRYLIYGLIGLWVGLNAKADSFALAAENDTLSLPKSDMNYTHGTSLKYMREKPLWIFDEWGVEVEQTIYGPPLLKIDELQPNDHPYCGYLSFNFIGDQWFDLGWADLSLEHSFGLGGVGPNSFSEDSQRIIHKWLGVKEPLGWKYQIKDEFIVQYEFWANLNIPVFEEDVFTAYIVPRAGADVGGFKDMLATGLDLKFGLNPAENVGHGMILSAPKNKKTSDWSAFLLVGVEGRCVFHDTSIDGGFFRESVYENQSEMWVGEFHWGCGLRYKRFEVEYMQFIRSKEFETQSVKPNYGRIVLKWLF